MLCACTSGAILEEKKEQPAKQEEKVVSRTKTEEKNYIPYPVTEKKLTSNRQRYTVLGSRVAKKMLKETSALYENKKPTLKITISPESDLHFDPAVEAIGNIIKSSYDLSESARGNDYTLEVQTQDFHYEDGEKVIAVCKIALKNSENKEIGTWAETLAPIANDDQSWW